ncbi:MAG: hypothetical protein WBI65_07170 [Dethiobacteria bacterium]
MKLRRRFKRRGLLPPGLEHRRCELYTPSLAIKQNYAFRDQGGRKYTMETAREAVERSFPGSGRCCVNGS